MSDVISAEELDRRTTGVKWPYPVLLDVRWQLGRDDGRAGYDSGHIPGAVYLDLDRDLTGPPGPAGGRHPLPDPAKLQRAFDHFGLFDDVDIYVYDDWQGFGSARVWWLLRWAGLRRVQVLDGGLQAWRERKGVHSLQTGYVGPRSYGNPEVETRRRPQVRPGSLPVIDADGAAALGRDGVLLDARAAERYRGEIEPHDARPGHIPGAVSAPATDNADAAGRLRDTDELARRFAALGVDWDRPVGVYCGSGVSAAYEILALREAGIEAALYPGSWSQWSADPDRPAATGPEPG